MSNRFPKQLCVAIKHDGDDIWYDTNTVAARLLEDDGPILVATYELVEVQQVEKYVTFQKVRPRGHHSH